MRTGEFTGQSVHCSFQNSERLSRSHLARSSCWLGMAPAPFCLQRTQGCHFSPGAPGISLHTATMLCWLCDSLQVFTAGDPPQLQNRPHVPGSASQDKLLKFSLLIRWDLLGKEKKKVFPRAKSYAFTLRIAKTAKSEATLQHKGNMLLEAEQSSLGDRPTWWDAPGCLHS